MGVGTEGDGARERERFQEGSGLVAEFSDGERGEPLRSGPSEGEVRGWVGAEAGCPSEAGQGRGLGGGEPGAHEEGEPERGRGVHADEPGEPAAPEANTEDGLGERTPLGIGGLPAAAQECVQLPLRGLTRKDVLKGFEQSRSERRERGPLDAEETRGCRGWQDSHWRHWAVDFEKARF